MFYLKRQHCSGILTCKSSGVNVSGYRRQLGAAAGLTSLNSGIQGNAREDELPAGVGHESVSCFLHPSAPSASKQNPTFVHIWYLVRDLEYDLEFCLPKSNNRIKSRYFMNGKTHASLFCSRFMTENTYVQVLNEFESVNQIKQIFI